MKSATQILVKAAATRGRGINRPKSSTGGAKRRNWAYNPKHAAPSRVHTVPVGTIAAQNAQYQH